MNAIDGTIFGVKDLVVGVWEPTKNWFKD